MKVLIVAKYTAESAARAKDEGIGVIEFLIVVKSPRARISRKQTIEGRIDGNPYLNYGEAVEAFTGVPYLETKITVASVSSGNLDDWR